MTPLTPAPSRESAERPPRILVFGDVMDDVIVTPAGPTSTSDTLAKIQHRAGGAAANTAAWLGTLGADVQFVGRVGAGDVERHSQLLRSANVHPRLEHSVLEPTGTVVLTMGDGTRTMFTDRGAAGGLEVDAISDDLLRGLDLVHFTGYSIVQQTSPVPLRRLLGRIRAAGVRLSVDPASSGFIDHFGAEAFLGLVRGADYFFPSLDEGRLLTGSTDPDDVVSALAGHFGVVAALLPDGSAVAGSSRVGSAPGSSGGGSVAGSSPAARQAGRLLHAPPAATRFVDPLGAGEAFSAGFLCAALRSSSLAIALRKGAKTAALALAVVGGRPRT